MPDKTNQLKGSLAALIVNLIFGFSFLFSKVSLKYAHPLVILASRFTIAFAVMNLLWLTGIVKLKFKGKPKKRILMMSIAQPLLYFILELYGIENTSSAISGVIISLVPVIVIVLSVVFLREKPTLRQVLFSLLSLISISVISILADNGAKNKLLGIILLLGAALCAAVFNILSRTESEHYSPFERTYIMFLVGTVGFNVIATIGLRGRYITEITSAFTSFEFIGAILYLSVASSIVAFMLYNYSTTILTPVRSASFSNLITVVSVLAGIFILGEKLSVSQLICCVLIIAGVWGVNQKTTSDNKKAAE
ncbi:MAG: DMT family transporter [Ruminococcaceae bacterium]|nr:DMT family transporter [Oscillospiraceae bacterium]